MEVVGRLKSVTYTYLRMESFPPKRRPGVFINLQGGGSLRKPADRSDSTTTSQPLAGCSRGRGKLIETVLALVKHSPGGKKVTFPTNFFNVICG